MYVGDLTIFGSDNGLAPVRQQAIIWTNPGILLNGPLGTNFSEHLIKNATLSFKKMRLKVSSAKRWPFCLGCLNVLITLLDGRWKSTNIWILIQRFHNYPDCRPRGRILPCLWFEKANEFVVEHEIWSKEEQYYHTLYVFLSLYGEDQIGICIKGDTSGTSGVCWQVIDV